MDTELFTAFQNLNDKFDDHKQYVEERIDGHDRKLQDICNYIKNRKEAKAEKSENNNKRFYVAIAIIGVTFGTAQMIQGFI